MKLRSASLLAYAPLLSGMLLTACGGGGASPAPAGAPAAPAPVMPVTPVDPIAPPAAPATPAPPVSPPAAIVPVIFVQPQTASVSPGEAATFSVSASAATSLTYQWSRNGVDVPGASAPTYVHPSVLPGDSATVIRVKVSTDTAQVSSQPASLIVTGPGIRPFVGYNFAYGPTSTLPGSHAKTLPTYGFEGMADGLGQEARASAMNGLAIDGAGNVYAAEYLNLRVRKISPAGLMTTLAGTGASGQQDGPGLTATFMSPSDIAASAGGTVYVHDKTYTRPSNYPLRKISPSGQVSTVTLPHDPDNINGDGSVARERIDSFTVDRQENLYVSTTAELKDRCPPNAVSLHGSSCAFYMRSMIRKVTPGGVVSTLLTSEQAFASQRHRDDQFHFSVSAMIVDSAETLFFANERQIFTVRMPGTANWMAGGRFRSTIDGMGEDSGMNRITAMALDSGGNIFVLEDGPAVIRKVTQAGAITTVAGSFVEAPTYGGVKGQLKYVRGLVIDADDNLYTSTGTGILKISFH